MQFSGGSDFGEFELNEMKHMVTRIVDHLTVIQDHLNTVRQYFLAKLKRVVVKPTQSRSGSENRMSIAEKKFVQPLFSDMNHPKQDQVGLLLPLTCGHNGRPTEVESLILGMHLEAAGFFNTEEESSKSGFSSIDNVPAIGSPSKVY